ncbi:MAG TPA: cytochrome c [Methylophilaceae bacterium]|nr:cytochrome c [Methylophilaceae bacterium]
MMIDKDTAPASSENDPIDPMDRELSTLEIHHAVMREASDPDEAFDPGPRWFYVLSIVALVVAGFYLGQHMGVFGTTAHIGYLPPGVPRGAEVAAAKTAGPSISGATVYNGKCSSCHQPNGQGVPGAFPPLAGSPFVVEDPAIPVRIVLRGLHGQIEVEGATYNGVMPAWADLLTDAEIAAVVSHIRGKLGDNKAEPVKEDFVARIRQETASRTTPWTAEELKGGNP